MKIRTVGQVLSLSIALASMACTSTALATATSPRSGPAAMRPAADQVTVPLADASRPALIDMSLVSGSITVRGTNRKDVLVTARRSWVRSTAAGRSSSCARSTVTSTCERGGDC